MAVVNTDQIGMPTPTGWEVQKFRVRNPNDGSPCTLVKLTLSVPSGLVTVFLNGEEAQRMASAIKKAGKDAATGLWTPESSLAGASSGISDPFRPEGPMATSSGLTPDVSR